MMSPRILFARADRARDLDRDNDLNRALDRALDRDNDIDHALAYAIDHDLTRDLDLARARDLNRALGSDLIHARNLTSALTGDLVYDLANPPDFVLASDLDRASHLASELASVLTCDLDHALASDLPIVSALDHDLDRASHLASELASELDLASELAAQAASRTGKTPAQRPARLVAAPAKGMVVAASRLLPAADRARYYEEYLSELWDLAAAGARRSKQVSYAARQMIRAVPLRYTVLATHRRKAPL